MTTTTSARITGQSSGVESNPIPRKPLHVRHGGIGVEIGFVIHLPLQDGEYTCGGLVSVLATRNGGHRPQQRRRRARPDADCPDLPHPRRRRDGDSRRNNLLESVAGAPRHGVSADDGGEATLESFDAATGVACMRTGGALRRLSVGHDHPQARRRADHQALRAGSQAGRKHRRRACHRRPESPLQGLGGLAVGHG